jgi:hypothetical protein
MAKYLVTLTSSDDYADIKHFVHVLTKHELAEPDLHGKNIFYSKTPVHLHKGDTLIWLYAHSRKDDVYLVGYAAIDHSVQGLFFGIQGHDGKRTKYQSIFSIQPETKMVKAVKLSKKQCGEVFKSTFEKHAKAGERPTEFYFGHGAFISEKEFKKLKALLK